MSLFSRRSLYRERATISLTSWRKRYVVLSRDQPREAARGVEEFRSIWKLAVILFGEPAIVNRYFPASGTGINAIAAPKAPEELLPKARKSRCVGWRFVINKSQTTAKSMSHGAP